LHPPLSPILSSPAPAPTQPPTLSLHDALPICRQTNRDRVVPATPSRPPPPAPRRHDLVAGRAASRSRRHSRNPIRQIYDRSGRRDRKSTRLNSSHSQISYAVFCLKKKKKDIKL